jgi:hypothetical protein
MTKTKKRDMTEGQRWTLLHLLANEMDADVESLESMAADALKKATKLRQQADELRDLAEEFRPHKGANRRRVRLP